MNYIFESITEENDGCTAFLPRRLEVFGMLLSDTRYFLNLNPLGILFLSCQYILSAEKQKKKEFFFKLLPWPNLLRKITNKFLLCRIENSCTLMVNKTK